MANTFVIGELVRIAGRFEQNSTLIDPGTVTLIVDVAGSTQQTLGSTSWVNDGVGLFHYDHDATSTGVVEYRWKSANPQGAAEAYFLVERSRVPTP